MTVHSISRSDGPEQPDLSAPHQVRPRAGHAESDHPGVGPPARSPAPEAAPASVLDLVNRTLADTTRTTNAATIVTAVSTSAARIVLSVGVVLIASLAVAGLLIHFAGLGPALGGAVAVGGTTAVASGRYLWNRRAAKRPEDVLKIESSQERPPEGVSASASAASVPNHHSQIGLGPSSDVVQETCAVEGTTDPREALSL